MLLTILFGACSFEYGPSESDTEGMPDIVMREVEYVRVRNGDPTVRFQAELAERYEKRQTMELRNFSFEQFDTHQEETDALGRAGAASVELDSGNIHLGNGVRIEVGSEDIVIETGRLEWRDKEKKLLGEESAEVNIFRTDGTSFTGRGFSADARNRTWEFSAGAAGTYVDGDDEEEPPAEDEAEGAEGAEGGEEVPEEGEAPSAELGEENGDAL